jgi:uncharacterized protein with ATP-grasp and redox domains
MHQIVSPLPSPLRGIEKGSFAEHTVKIRLREIGRRTLEENEFSPEIGARLQALIDDLPDGRIRLLRDVGAPDYHSWQSYTTRYLNQTWLEVPWFFAETYFYRRILEATGYFSAGTGFGRDPYRHQKQQGLESFTPAVQAAAAHAETLMAQAQMDRKQDRLITCELLSEIVSLSLWGNQADLSMWPAGQDNRPEAGQSLIANRDPFLVINEIEAVHDYLNRAAPMQVDIILDNSGLELVNDLLLADFLLTSDLAKHVRLHTKSHPTFVSDATAKDVEATLDFMLANDAEALCRTGRRILEHILSGKLQIQSHTYWTSPLAFWDAPEAINQLMSGSRMVISKGDANYRRFLGDRHWDYYLPAASALGYLQIPFLALRVCKSEIIIGLQPGKAERLREKEPQWLVNGRWGLVQCLLGNR